MTRASGSNPVVKIALCFFFCFVLFFFCFFFFFFFFCILRRVGKDKITLKLAATLPRVFVHTRRVSIKLIWVRNPAGFLTCPSVPAIAMALGRLRYHSGSARRGPCESNELYALHTDGESRGNSAKNGHSLWSSRR